MGDLQQLTTYMFHSVWRLSVTPLLSNIELSQMASSFYRSFQMET